MTYYVLICGGVYICRCPAAFMGLHCQTHVPDLDEDNGGMTGTEASITIGLPILVVIVVLCVGSAGFVWKKRQQCKPFQHVLMEEVATEEVDSEAAINNPMFVKDETQDESQVLHPDRVAFANPVYESNFYDQHGKRDSTEKSGLLPLHQDDLQLRRINGNATLKV